MPENRDEFTTRNEGTIYASNNGVNGAFNDGIIHQVCPYGETPGDKQRNAKALIEQYVSSQEHPGNVAISSQPFQAGRLDAIKKNRTVNVERDSLQDNELAVSLGNHGTRNEHWGQDDEDENRRLVYKNAHETPTIQHYELIGTVHPSHVTNRISQLSSNYDYFSNVRRELFDDFSDADEEGHDINFFPIASNMEPDYNIGDIDEFENFFSD